MQDQEVAVVIPCYKVRQQILSVIAQIGPEVSMIFVVDDCCPQKSGDFVAANCPDERVVILRHAENQGVGGAVITGYQAAIAAGIDVIVKIDGDGQMDPSLIPRFIDPILSGEADYTKGNRFYDLEKINAMPKMRLFGNAVLSFMTKLSSGYWTLFDPTNGYTAIHCEVARHLPFKKISRRYFFETDILFRLNTLRAVAVDVPMDAKYEDEVSNLRISKVVGEFMRKHMRNMLKRIFYNYYLRDMSLASLEMPIGLLMITFGCTFGGYHWISSNYAGTPTPLGTIMFSALPIIIGIQLVLAFLSYDINSVPQRVIHNKYNKRRYLDKRS